MRDQLFPKSRVGTGRAAGRRVDDLAGAAADDGLSLSERGGPRRICAGRWEGAPPRGADHGGGAGRRPTGTVGGGGGRGGERGDRPGGVPPPEGARLAGELGTSDDHAGLRAVLGRHCHGGSWQRCPVHCSRNRQGLVGATHRGRLAVDRRGVVAASDGAQARSQARACADRWRRSYPAGAAKREEELEA